MSSAAIAIKLRTIAERVQRPGLMSAVGIRRERLCTCDLQRYFSVIGRAVRALHVESIVASEHPQEGDTKPVERILALVDTKVARVLQRYQPVLLQALAMHLFDAYSEGYKATLLKEADYQQIDKFGPSGRAAADWAAKHSAELVVGINKTTQRQIAAAVKSAIENRAGADSIVGYIDNLLDEFSNYRAKLIASTEMNNAFSEAALNKMTALDYKYKELVPAEDACEECIGIAEEGPVPVDELFSDGSMRTPIHPGCRCAIVAARAPNEEED